jgi:predicted transcriptional regulator
MTKTEPKNIGVRKKRWVVCFENTILELDLSIYEKMVYIVLCSHAKKDGPAFPGVKTIAKEAGCSRTKVFEALNTLEEQGIITRDKRIFEGRGQTSNLYEIIDIAPRPQDEQGSDCHAPSPSARRTGESAARTGGVRDTDALLNVFEQEVFNKTKEQTPPLSPPGGDGEGGKAPEEQKRHDTEEKAKEIQNLEPESFELVLNAYNSVLPELPKAEKVTVSRAKIIKQRIEEDLERRKLEWWKQFFARVREFPWPMGNNPNNWSADFDWLLSEKGMQKILEGAFRRSYCSGDATRAGLETQKKYTDTGGRINAKELLRQARISKIHG